jgi:hypothetical protein
MQTNYPVATASRSDLDATAYGEPRAPHRSYPAPPADSGGPIATPGQYPYVPNMSVENAVAIAGGFSPRAKPDSVTLTHNAGHTIVPLGPGDTILVGERWF